MTSSGTWIAGQPGQWLCASLAGLLIGACAPASANSDTTGVSASVTLASDYMFRGFSQSKGNPALQAGAAWAGASGWIVGAWGSNVDFVDDGLLGPATQFARRADDHLVIVSPRGVQIRASKDPLAQPVDEDRMGQRHQRPIRPQVHAGNR